MQRRPKRLGSAGSVMKSKKQRMQWESCSWRAIARYGLFALLLTSATAQTVNAQQTTPSVVANIDDPKLQRRGLPVANAQSPTLPAPEDVAQAQLTPGTLLSMDVFGIPDFSGLSLRIDEHGDVFIPTLGKLHVAASTLLEAQAAISKALVESEILVSPVVQLSLVQFAPGYVSVLGEVENPGRYQMIAARSLADVLALAGGETLAAGGDIEIQHTKVGQTGGSEHIHATQRSSLTELQSTTVQPGDTVYVRRAGVVYILGAVNKPGGYLMVDDGALNIYQALALAGGTNLDAARNGMYILRPHDEMFQMIKVPFVKLASQRQTESQLQVNDVLYVPRSGLRVTLLDGSSILGAAVGATIYTAR